MEPIERDTYRKPWFGADMCEFENFSIRQPTHSQQSWYSCISNCTAPFIQNCIARNMVLGNKEPQAHAIPPANIISEAANWFPVYECLVRRILKSK